MKISISENLRRLRVSREMTQEELAEFLGVSSQAVSKWERGDNFPDLALVPLIAAYFDVTTDELLGTDAVRDEQRLAAARERTFEVMPGNVYHREIAELWRDLARDMPNNHGVQLNYADCLSTRVDEDFSAQKEAIAIVERVLAKSTDDVLRANAIRMIALLNAEIGDFDKAREYAEKMHDLSAFTLKGQISDISFRRNAKEYDAERAEDEFIYPHILALANYLHRAWESLRIIRERRRELGLEREGEFFEQVELEKYLSEIQQSASLNRLYGTIPDERKYQPYYVNLADEYLRLGDVEKSLDCVEKIVDGYATWGERLRQIMVSYSERAVNDDGEWVNILKTHSLGEEALRNFGDAKFDLIRSEPRFIAALERLK